MYILGLHNDEDSGVALLKDGRIIDAVSEERLNRKKLYKGPPELSLQYVLAKNGITLSDINHVAYGWHGRQNDYRSYARKLTRRLVRAMHENPDAGAIMSERIDVEFSRDDETRREFEAWMADMGWTSDRITFLDHHAAHCWGAFGCSPFEEAFVFTFDGRGDLKSTTVSTADTHKGLSEQDYLLSFDSLGFLYGQITHYLGFTPHRHEGKVTGLAAFGNPAKTLPLFRKLVSFDEGEFVAHISPYRPYYTNMHPGLIAELNRFSKEDVAAGVQVHCEELIASYVAYWIKKIDRPDIRSVCLAGGVAANVKINQRIAELAGVDHLYVFPHMGDGGLPLGSAIQTQFHLTGQAKVQMDTVYLGPSYDDAEIEALLKKNAGKLDFERFGDKTAETVQDLVDQKVIGWFDGRMEYGPRALGARSILFHTRDRNANDWLNRRMRRTEFMPFAPVTPDVYAAESYKGWDPEDRCVRFMTRTHDCTEAFKAGHPAVVHIDGTARPQIVRPELNGDYYRVVRAYCDRTGERALINTSFNAHEEPIVCSPDDAINSLLDGVIDILAIGSFRVRLRDV